ncbi:hypothetical protein A1O3_00768 [Capronia epimyces CBS 606.96]|uniref:C2H2-type domain-containing protein n=1 Tax=Capronia epimyces CBS 606.96 TaxID=1182542 RepID=W9YI37_9EURO|nr:uncharacterized protein A1O3_00768 [Capronia epimyces CBS 606.96]EXJ92218.1 hypothetical protein A1O3_00768 [Capronia epimyces CBS 606.96]
MASDGLNNYAFFEHTAGSEWLFALVNARLAEIVATLQLSSPPDSESGCLLADIGDYLVRCIVVLSRVAEELADGVHVRRYATAGIEYMEEGSGFSDLGLLSYMDNKHKSLRQLAASIRLAAEEAETHWQQSQKPPEITRELGRRLRSSNSPVNTNHSAQMGDIGHASAGYAGGPSQPRYAGLASGTATALDTVDSPNSDDSVYDTIQDCLRELSSTPRGKGEHVCPLGTRCSKGGVSADGTLIRFERNSAFKAHLQKHEKSYKCDIPGCKNKKGFARIDQLRRHQEIVPHHR